MVTIHKHALLADHLLRSFSFPDEELVYRDPTGGLSILNVQNLTVRMLMTNTTFVSFFFVTIFKILAWFPGSNICHHFRDN